MPRSATQLDAGKRGLNMNFDHEELMLMMLYNSGTRLGLIHETGHRKTETADRCGVWRVGISPGLIIAACGRRT